MYPYFTSKKKTFHKIYIALKLEIEEKVILVHVTNIKCYKILLVAKIKCHKIWNVQKYKRRRTNNINHHA